MSNPGGVNPQAGGQAPQPSGGQAPPPSDASGQEPNGKTESQYQSDLTPEQLRAELSRVRREAASYRTKLAEYEAQKTAAERAQMDEATRAKAEAAEYKQKFEQARESARKSALMGQVGMKVGPLGIVDPEAALALIREQVSYNEKDEPENVDELLTRLVQAKPWLTSAANATSRTSTANAPRPQQGTLLITKEQLRDYQFQKQFKLEHQMTVGEALEKGLARLQ